MKGNSMRLINADEVQRIIGYIRTKYVDTHNQFFWDTIRYIEKKVRSIPTIEAAPVVHGEWEEIRNAYGELEGWIHVKCGREVKRMENFCPNCGADMRKEKEVMPAKFNENGCPFDSPCLDDYPDCYCNEKMDGKE